MKCAVDFCGREAKCRGYCGTHYSRLRRTGDPLGMKRHRYTDGVQCSIDGCGRQAQDRGMCGMHAQRVRRYGDPNYITPEAERRRRLREAQPTLGKLKPTTYGKRYGRHEHRVVAEQKLGRPLRPGEIVHHIDGDKHNNHPDNLEVITQAEHIREHRAQLIAARKEKKHAAA